MSYFFTDPFKAALAANQGIMDGKKVRLVLFRYAPAMSVINPAWAAANTVAQLVASSPGWVEVSGVGGYPLTQEIDVGSRVLPPPNEGSRYVIYTEYPFAGLAEPVSVAAIGVVLVSTGQLIFVTNTPLRGLPNIKPGDKLTSNPADQFPDSSNRYLFAWSVATPDPNEGPLVIGLGPPEFEVSGSQHTWLYPQRANMIANPSFEKPGTDYWSANGAIQRQSVAMEPAYLTPSVGLASTPDAAALNITGDVRFTAKIRDDSVESTTSRSVIAKSDTNTTALSWRFGHTYLTGWNVTAYPSGTASPQTVVHAATRTNLGLTPPGTDRYVGAVLTGVSPTTALTLRAQIIESAEGTVWTNEGAQSAAIAANTMSNDSASPLLIGQAMQGRIYWAQMEEINRAELVFSGAAGNYLTTPDAAPLNITGDLTIVWDMDVPSWTPAVSGWIVAKGSSQSVGGSAYGLAHMTTGTFQLWIDSPAGLLFLGSPPLTGLPLGRRMFAVSLDVDNGASGKVHEWLTSTDQGATWTSLGRTTVAGTTSIKTAALILNVGGRSVGTAMFVGTLHRVQIRSGVGASGAVGGTTVFDMAGNNAGKMVTQTTFTASTGQTMTVFGSVVKPLSDKLMWRFDASEYPGTGTSYTDPRGRTWTLANPTAITPAKDPSWAGGVTPTGGVSIMESNLFSTQMGESFSEQWTIQLLARGTGKLKVGLVYWDADYRATAVDWGDDEEWNLVAGAWIHVATHRHAPEAHLAMVRLEAQGSLTIDKVLAEPGYLKDWLYFDGDDRYGARDDFSWYGGSNRQGASYSLWYNHRKAVVGRLFARTVDPNDPSANVTDEDMEEQGLVYRWVPAGITVVPHLDVFYPFDNQNPVAPKAAGVLPYAAAGVDGVPSPW